MAGQVVAQLFKLPVQHSPGVGHGFHVIEGDVVLIDALQGHELHAFRERRHLFKGNVPPPLNDDLGRLF